MKMLMPILMSYYIITFNVTANDVNSGLYDTVKYLMDHVIKHFTNACYFKRYVILYIANLIMKIVQLTTTSFKTPTRNAQIIM